MTTRSWLRNLIASRKPRTIRKAPARLQVRVEMLEDCLAEAQVSLAIRHARPP